MPPESDPSANRSSPDNPASCAEADPIAIITAVGTQLAAEARLACTAEIQDLVIITYIGLLDSPPPERLNQQRLLQRCRQNLIIWAWEQGAADQPLPIARPASLA